MLLFVATLGLAGCVPGPVGQVRQLTITEVQARADAELDWSLAEQEPIGAQCDADRSRMRVIIVRTHEEMQSAAGYVCGPSADGQGGEWEEEGDVWCRWGRAAGAYRRARSGGMWPFALAGDQWPALIMWYSVASPALVRHEALHWLADCAGGDPNGDRSHSREVFR